MRSLLPPPTLSLRYDAFVDACYTAEAQARFEHARQSMRAKQAAKRKAQAADKASGKTEAGAGCGGGASASALPGGRAGVNDRVVLLGTYCARACVCGSRACRDVAALGRASACCFRECPAESDGVVYEVMRPCHLQAATACLVDVWVGHNVIMNALSVTKEDFQPLAAKRCRDGVSDEAADARTRAD